MPRKKGKQSTELWKNTDKDRELKYLQDTFSSQIDPDVVYFVFAESSYDVNLALESLLTIASGDESAIKGNELKLNWNKSCKEEVVNREQDHIDDGASVLQNSETMQFNKQCGSKLYSASQDLYHSNEDLCTEDGMLEKINPSDELYFNGELPSNSEICASENLNASDISVGTVHKGKPFEILSDVLSPQSDCSLEADASDSIDTAFDLGVNSNCNNYSLLQPSFYNQTSFNMHQMSKRGSDPQSIHHPIFSGSMYCPSAIPTPMFVPRLPLNCQFNPWYKPPASIFSGNVIAPTPSKDRQFHPPKKVSPSIAKILIRISQGEKVLIVLRGLPGSGKTTLAEKLINRSGVICSTDNYFMHRSKYVYDPFKLSEAHEWNQKRAKKAMEDGKSPVIIDNTNVEMWEMQPYVVWGVRYSYHIEILEPDTSWKFKVNELAVKNKHSITREKIQMMLDRYQHNVTVNKILGKKNVESTKMDVTKDKKISSNIRQGKTGPNDKSCQIQDDSYKSPEWDLPIVEPVLPVEKTTDYVEEDPAFWQTSNDATESDASAETVIENKRENKVFSPSKNRFRNRHAQGELKTVEDVAQASSAMQENKSQSDKVEKMSDVKTSDSNTTSRGTETGHVPEKNSCNNIDNKFKKKITKKLAANFDPTFSVHPDWKIPKFPSESTENLIPTNENCCSDSCTQVEEKYFSQTDKLSPSDILLSSQGLCTSDNTIEYPVYTLGKCNKSCMTEEITDCGNTDLKGMDSDEKFNYLKELFPQVLEDNLRDLFQKCDENLDWTIDLLLESKHECVLPVDKKSPNVNLKTTEKVCDSPTTVDENSDLKIEDVLDEAIDDALSILSDSNDEKQSNRDILVVSPVTNLDNYESSSIKLSPEENCQVKKETEIREDNFKKKAESNSIEPRNNDAIDLDFGKFSIFRNDGLVLNLDPAFAMQLEELFGPANCTLDKENLEVQLDLKLAWQLYNCWISSVRKKCDENYTEFDRCLSANGEFDRSYPERKVISKQRRSRSFDSAMGKRRRRKRTDSECDFDEIMRTEHAMLKSENQSANIVKDILKQADLATKIKKHLLYEEFPDVDRTALNNIYVANKFSKGITEEEILATLGNSLFTRQESTNHRSEAKNQDMFSQVLTSPQPLDRQQFSHSPTQIIEPEDHRFEALIHYNKRREYQAKAQEAYRSGQGGAAYVYALEAQNSNERMIRAHENAALQILADNNSGKDKYTLDLHKLLVKEALAEAESFLLFNLQELRKSKQSKVVLCLITGKGNHSVAKVPRIKRAVMDYLTKKKIMYNEKHGGMLEVILNYTDII